MGHQIIRQPDGQYAVFSSIVDAWVLFDASPESLCNYYAMVAATEARERTQRKLEQINSGQRPYGQFTMSFDEAEETSVAHTGKTFEEIRAEGGVPWDDEVAVDDELVEGMAESAHDAWWGAYRELGYLSRLAEWGEEFMVPFADLSEQGKEFDRIIMRAIFAFFDSVGIQVVRPTP